MAQACLVKLPQAVACGFGTASALLAALEGCKEIAPLEFEYPADDDPLVCDDLDHNVVSVKVLSLDRELISRKEWEARKKAKEEERNAKAESEGEASTDGKVDSFVPTPSQPPDGGPVGEQHGD